MTSDQWNCGEDFSGTSIKWRKPGLVLELETLAGSNWGSDGRG